MAGTPLMVGSNGAQTERQPTLSETAALVGEVHTSLLRLEEAWQAFREGPTPTTTSGTSQVLPASAVDRLTAMTDGLRWAIERIEGLAERISVRA